MVISINEIIASISAGCASTLIGHPLDTIKVYQQTSSQKTKLNFIETTKRIFVLGNNNPLVFFKGIAPPLFNQILMNTVMFSVFNQIKSFSFWNDCENDSGSSGGYTMALSAGLLSGFATACLSTPTDWIKIQAQLQGTNTSIKRSSKNSATSLGSMAIMCNLLKENKNHLGKVTRILYRGHAANLGREGIFTMVYLGFYDRIMNNRTDISKEEQNNNSSGRSSRLDHVIAASAFTGALAWILSYPFDTIKSVMQAKSSSSSSRGGSSKTTMNYSNIIKDIWRIGGISSFYRGCGASTIRAILVTSVRMLAYESTSSFLR